MRLQKSLQKTKEKLKGRFKRRRADKNEEAAEVIENPSEESLSEEAVQAQEWFEFIDIFKKSLYRKCIGSFKLFFENKF